MQRLRWLTLVWPGLPQLWFAGSGLGLALAAGFAALLNLGLVCSRLWTELFSPEIQTMIWLAAGAIWISSAAISARWVAGLRISGPSAGDEDLFNAAQSEYLRGNWYEAEVALGRLLARNLVDVEARLMLAALLRRTGRLQEAGEQLKRLSRTDGAERWQPEIARLRNRLAEQTHDAAETTAEAANNSDVAADEPSDDATDAEQVSQAA
jgi:hypothetical protein